MFAFYTSLSKRTKYSKLCVFLTDLESDTQWGRDHRNFIEAFVYSEFDMFMITSLNQYFKRETNITRKPKSMDGSRNRSCILSFLSKQVRRDRNIQTKTYEQLSTIMRCNIITIALTRTSLVVYV